MRDNFNMCQPLLVTATAVRQTDENVSEDYGYFSCMVQFVAGNTVLT
jgi:hypothetical protein